MVGAVTWRDRAAARVGHALAWWRSRDGRNLSIVLAVALLARLVLMPFHGFYNDMGVFVDWGRAANAHFWNFYSSESHVYEAPDYPPLAIYVFAALTAIYLHLAHASLSVLYFLIKVPIVVADLVITALVYLLARHAVAPRWAFIAALSYALSPPVLMVGAAWGQIESLYSLAVLAACVFAVRQRSVAAGAAFALAVMIKPQPIIFAPLLLTYVVRSAGWRPALRALAGMVGVMLAICLPYLIPPRLEMIAFYRDTTTWLAADPRASISAYNLWWMLGLQGHNYAAPLLGPLSANMLGWLLFALVVALASVVVWRNAEPARLFGAVALVALAFFVLTTLQRERYMFPVLAPLVVAAAYDRKYVVAYVVTTVTASLNMAASAAVSITGATVGAAGRWADFPVLKNVLAWHDYQLWRDVLSWKQLVTDHTEFGAANGAMNVVVLVSLIALFMLALRMRAPQRVADANSTTAPLATPAAATAEIGRRFA